MKAVILFLFTFQVITANAQEKAKRDSVIPAGPNEIYFNVGPVLSMLQGAFAVNEMNLACMYKRVLKNPRFALRTGIALKTESPYNRKSKPHYYKREVNTVVTPDLNDSYWYFDQTDTSRTKNYLDERLYSKLQLNFGFERRGKNYKRLIGFIGMDAAAGLWTRSYELYDVDEELAPDGVWYVANRDDAVLLLDYKKSSSFYFGASPKAGLSFSLTPRLAISAQVGVLFTLDFHDSFTRTMDGRAIVQRKGDADFDFGVNGVIDELNLVLRF